MARSVFDAGVLLAVCGLAACGPLVPQTLLNPARVDIDMASADRSAGARPTNIAAIAGTFPTQPQVEGASFAAAWKVAAAKATPCVDDKSTKPEGCTKSTDLAAGDPINRIFLRRGMALSDRLCANWFQQLSEMQANLNFNRSLVGDAGTLASAIMGFTSVAAPAIGGVAATTGFLQGVLTNTQANFIVAPDVGLVQQLVEKERVAIVDEQRGETGNITYEEALTRLIAYDNTCSHAAVKRLVNESVTAATGRTADPAALALVVDVLQPFFKPKLSTDDVVALYGVCAGAASGEQKTKLLAALKESKLVTDDKCTFADGALRRAGDATLVKTLLKSDSYKPTLQASLEAAADAKEDSASAPAPKTKSAASTSRTMRRAGTIPPLPK